MKRRTIVCAALAAVLTMSVAVSGCDTINEEDIKQTVATVDITASSSLEEDVEYGVKLSEYAQAISSSKEISKRDLIAAFYNAGSSLVNSYSYAEIFNMLINALTSTAVVTQYATLSLIREKADGNMYPDSDFSYDEYLSMTSEIERYEYLLDGVTTDAEDDSAGSSRVLLARYALYTSINSSLDSLEESIIDGEDETSSSSDTRATPSGAGTEKENFLPLSGNDDYGAFGEDDGALDYGVFTGYSSVSAGYDYSIENSGIYEDDRLEGSTTQTRRRAYAAFVTNLRDNYLLTDEDDVRDVLSLSYIREEYLAQLQQQVIDEYYETYQAAQEKLIESQDDDGTYTFLSERYAADLANQQISNSTTTEFESSMSSLSDTSFILWNPGTDGTEGGTYGYVYNILLPFNAAQNIFIDTTDTSAEYYFARKDILDDITTTDQRSAWFNGTTDYSFNAEDENINYSEEYYKGTGYSYNENRNYLFFEDNLTKTDRYESLDKYIGHYSYNGTVAKNDDDTYRLTPKKMNIDQMMEEFVGYIEFVLGSGTVSYAKQDSYNVTSASDYYTAETADLPEEDREIDYSRFIYGTGHVTLGDTSLANMFVKDSTAYLAMSAVNELQYAYTTDTSVLSQYIGYTVSAYDTNYVPEFEYAAQAAVKEGAGTFYVCATDYGWHILYVTATYSTSAGPVYGDLTWTEADVKTEGTFQNLYYNWIKDTILSDVATNRRSVLNELYGGDATVTKYEDAYKDLLELGN